MADGSLFWCAVLRQHSTTALLVYSVRSDVSNCLKVWNQNELVRWCLMWHLQGLLVFGRHHGEAPLEGDPVESE